MQTHTLDTRAANNKLAAYLNARERSAKAQSTYTALEQQIANAVYAAVRTTYTSSKCYLTYRNKFITVKVCNPKGVAQRSVKQLEQQLHAMNVEKAVTAQGIIYRIM